ncbi:hypothetical protein Tco_0287683 [Tanacetum coccineum]
MAGLAPAFQNHNTPSLEPTGVISSLITTIIVPQSWAVTFKMALSSALKATIALLIIVVVVTVVVVVVVTVVVVVVSVVVVVVVTVVVVVVTVVVVVVVGIGRSAPTILAWVSILHQLPLYTLINFFEWFFDFDAFTTAKNHIGQSTILSEFATTSVPGLYDSTSQSNYLDLTLGAVHYQSHFLLCLPMAWLWAASVVVVLTMGIPPCKASSCRVQVGGNLNWASCGQLLTAEHRFPFSRKPSEVSPTGLLSAFEGPKFLALLASDSAFCEQQLLGSN